MKVFILGGTGFIGYHATLSLIQIGHRVKTMALPPAPRGRRLPQTRFWVQACGHTPDGHRLELAWWMTKHG